MTSRELTTQNESFLKIEEQNGVRMVNARDLWRKLEVKRDFTNWLKGRIQEYGFEEEADYFKMGLFAKFGEKSSGMGRPQKEYYLTLDMAKELAMVEKNEQGRIVRQYFIRVEKKFVRMMQSLVADPNSSFRKEITNTIKQELESVREDYQDQLKAELEAYELSPSEKRGKRLMIYQAVSKFCRDADSRKISINDLVDSIAESIAFPAKRFIFMELKESRALSPISDIASNYDTLVDMGILKSEINFLKRLMSTR